MRGGRRNSK